MALWGKGIPGSAKTGAMAERPEWPEQSDRENGEKLGQSWVQAVREWGAG